MVGFHALNHYTIREIRIFMIMTMPWIGGGVFCSRKRRLHRFLELGDIKVRFRLARITFEG